MIYACMHAYYDMHIMYATNAEKPTMEVKPNVTQTLAKAMTTTQRS